MWLAYFFKKRKVSENMKENKFLTILKKIGVFFLGILRGIGYFFRDLGIGIWNGIKKIGRSFKNFGARFVDSSIWTKIGHVIMGFGNFAHKQIIKGLIFLLIEVGFFTFMIASPRVNNTPFGFEAIPNFFTLGEEKGMKLSQTHSFKEDFTEVVKFPDDIFSKEAKETYDPIISQAARARTLLTTLEEGNYDKTKLTITENILDVDDPNALTKTVTDKGETVKELVYDDRYQNIITDNRFGTNDKYGYSIYKQGDNILLKTNSLYSLWINSDTEIDFNNKVSVKLVDKTNVDNEFEFDTPLQYGVFELNSNSEETGYLYFLLIQTAQLPTSGGILPSRARAKVILDNTDHQFDNSDASLISYDPEFVNSDIDNSFLMMLFGIVTFAVIGMFILVYILSIKSSYKADLDERAGKKPTTFIEDLKSLLDSRFHVTMLGPAIFFLVVFTIIPTILMILIAFTDMDTSGALSGQRLINWTGLENFITLFNGGTSNRIAKEVGRNFIHVLSWTLIWALVATFSCYFGGIFLAILINKKDVKLKKMWRTIFILTIAVPQFITLLILKNMLTDQGPINAVITALGGNPIDFLQQSSGGVTGRNAGGVWLARATVLVINLYIGIPYTMLMTSGILMNIPADLYEAATIDGANKWQMFKKITLPYVIFVTTPYLISSFIGNITSFNTIFLTTGGGPNLVGNGDIAGTTDLLVTWLYKMTIDEYIYNAGSIIGILTFIITATISLICYRNSKAYKEEDTFQ